MMLGKNINMHVPNNHTRYARCDQHSKIVIVIENGSPWPWQLVVAGYRLGSHEFVHVSNEQGHMTCALILFHKEPVKRQNTHCRFSILNHFMHVHQNAALINYISCCYNNRDVYYLSIFLLIP